MSAISRVVNDDQFSTVRALAGRRKGDCHLTRATRREFAAIVRLGKPVSGRNHFDDYGTLMLVLIGDDDPLGTFIVHLDSVKVHARRYDP